MARSEAALPIEALDTIGHRRQRSLWSDAGRRLAKNRLAVLAIIILTVITVVVIAGNYIDAVQRSDPRVQEYDTYLAPSTDHFFGTDNLGRDQWSRVLQGTWISLRIAIGVQIVVLTIGLTVGGLAALGGRTIDNIMMRFTDLAYAFPDLLFIILIRAAIQGRDWPVIEDPVVQMIIAISLVAWVTVARLVRGQMLSLKERDYVMAARALGVPSWRIVTQHMLPNAIGPIIVAIVFGIPLAIFAEAALGFIGLSVPAPTASLGRLVADGHRFVERDAWMVAIPAGVIALMMLCFTFLGDGLRDALDPRSR